MLTSLQNTKVKEWKKLQRRKNRNKEKKFLVEGFHLVEEAVNSGYHVEEIILREDIDAPETEKAPVTRVTSEVFAAIAETETPQGIAAVVHQKEWSYSPEKLTLLIDAVQDPGNLGTIIRTADAAGFNHIILGTGTVDPFNDKVIRATQGSIFHIPFFQGDLQVFLERLKENGTEIWASTLENGVPFKELSRPDKAALIVGNEGQGINDKIVETADQRVYIPIYGQAESLNVAIASAVLMYHLKG